MLETMEVLYQILSSDKTNDQVTKLFKQHPMKH